MGRACMREEHEGRRMGEWAGGEGREAGRGK